MENKVREMLSRYPLSENERLYLKTDTVTEKNQFQIKWLGENDVDEFNRHQKLCGKNTVEDDFLCDENARYCLLYADGIPAARGAIEKLSEDVWEVSDIYTAKAYRGKGLCTEVVKFICGEISANGKIISCRTRDDNESMKRVLEKTGFEIFGGKKMSIIQSHDITLYGGSDRNIVLRPLTDDDIPLLIDLNSDMEVLKWADPDAAEPYTEENIAGIWGYVSRDAWCFIIEVDGTPIGDCWLQKMNLPDIIKMYPESTKICRIDASIGRKEYWNKGIGTTFMSMLIDFAFNGTDTELLYCMCDKANIRSNRILQKNGYTHVEQNIYDGENHYRLTRQEYMTRRRYRPEQSKIMMMPLSELQPSQLYISEGKLCNVKEWLNPDDTDNFDPIPIKIFNGKQLMVDGHTRAVAAYFAGMESVPVYLDEDELDMAAYAVDLQWCEDEGVHSPIDLAGRIVSHKEYEVLWRKRCMEMQL